MKFTVKDVLIFIVIMSIAYFVVNNDSFDNKGESAKFGSKSRVEKKNFLRSSVSRPSVDDIPVFAPKTKRTGYVAIAGNVMPVQMANEMIKVQDRSEVEAIQSKKRQLIRDFSEGRISKAVLEKELSVLNKVKVQPKLKEISRADFTRDIEQIRQKRVERIRYGEYIKECVLEKLKTRDLKHTSQVVLRVNRDGQVTTYKVIISDTAKKNNNFGISTMDKLAYAVEKASPFQPFPKILSNEYDLTYILKMGGGNLTVSEFRGNISKPYVRIAEGSRRVPNPKQVEDVKLINASVVAIAREESGTGGAVSRLFTEKELNWYPVKSSNNMVSIKCIYKNGKLVDPVFMKKSEISEANEAALDALYSIKFPDMSEFETYPIVEIHGAFEVK